VALVVELPLSLLATGAALPLVITMMLRRDVIDVPNHRSSHVGRVPRGGGLACLLGVLVGLLAGQLRGDVPPWELAGIAAALALVGLADDLRTVPAAPRLGAQLLVGTLAGLLVGGGLFWMIAGAVVLAATVNVVNFMDGINGITGMTIGLWGVVALVVARENDSSRLMPLAAAAAGAAIGFLPANLPRAHLFLGDVGSYLFGALVGVGILVGWADGLPLAILVAPLSVYLADTSFTLIRRASRRVDLLSAHREHVYQRLVSTAGLSHTVVATFAVGLAALITLSWVPGSAALGLTVTTVLLSIYLGAVRLTKAMRR
jgi:UDP-N-acetylmuramyl pentapeptide phosphotransferase/UDP-N-acetylglucosamine-1-phosphate transferase